MSVIINKGIINSVSRTEVEVFLNLLFVFSRVIIDYNKKKKKDSAKF